MGVDQFGLVRMSVILRFCNKSYNRLRNLLVLLGLLRSVPFVEVIVVVMGDDIGDGVVSFGGRFRKVFVGGGGEFESSRANNVGASVAGSDVFVFQDADIVFDPEVYSRVLDLMVGGVESVKVGRSCVDLGEDVTAGVGVGGVDFGLLGGGSVRDAPGGCSAITRGAFVRVGGYCELFKYYGWEDFYYRYKTEQCCNHVVLDCCMFHLWHECNFQCGGWNRHRDLFDELLADSCGCVERDRLFLVERYEGLR